LAQAPFGCSPSSPVWPPIRPPSLTIGKITKGAVMSKARQVAVHKSDSRRLEEEARRMEAKLEVLRRTLDAPSGKGVTSVNGADGGSRWKSAGVSKPLTKGYVKTVMEAKPPGRPHGERRTPGGSAPGSGRASPRREPQEAPSAPAPALCDLVPLAAVAPAQPPPAQGGLAAGGRASANLQANLRKQSTEAAEVEAFLTGLSLERYVGLFMEHGFDCMDVVKDMEESHMRDIGMAPGHVIKLRKKIAETAPGERRRVNFGATEEAPAAEVPLKSSLKAPARQSTTTAACTESLAQGAFDEDESAASFQEALRAWREGTEPRPGPGGRAEEAPAVKAAAAGTSFWASMGGGEMDLSRASPTPTPTASSSTATESKCLPAPGSEKLCCYNCYKQFFAQYTVERTAPGACARPVRLCSEGCASAWEAAEQAKAEALRKRQGELEKLQELQRAAVAAEAPTDGPAPEAEPGVEQVV